MDRNFEFTEGNWKKSQTNLNWIKPDFGLVFGPWKPGLNLKYIER